MKQFNLVEHRRRVDSILRKIFILLAILLVIASSFLFELNQIFIVSFVIYFMLLLGTIFLDKSKYHYINKYIYCVIFASVITNIFALTGNMVLGTFIFFLFLLPAIAYFKPRVLVSYVSFLLFFNLIVYAVNSSEYLSNYELSSWLLAAFAYIIATGIGIIICKFVYEQLQYVLKQEERAENLSEKLKSVLSNANRLSDQLSTYTQILSTAANEGESSVEKTDVYIQDMSASIQEISATSEEVASFSQEAEGQVDTGRDNVSEMIRSIEEINDVVNNTVDAINKLVNNSEEIGQIVELINNIAEQTNLLALNASIEAARAGEYGEGFAVVAEEIRQLAEETAEATEDISELITRTQAQSQQGLKAIEQVEDKVDHGRKTAKKTGNVFAAIERSIKEVVDQIEQTAISTQEVAEGNDKILDSANEMTDIVEQFSTSADKLSRMVQKLNQIINNNQTED